MWIKKERVSFKKEDSDSDDNSLMRIMQELEETKQELEETKSEEKIKRKNNVVRKIVDDEVVVEDEEVVEEEEKAEVYFEDRFKDAGGMEEGDVFQNARIVEKEFMERQKRNVRYMAYYVIWLSDGAGFRHLVRVERGTKLSQLVDLYCRYSETLRSLVIPTVRGMDFREDPDATVEEADLESNDTLLLRIPSSRSSLVESAERRQDEPALEGVLRHLNVHQFNSNVESVSADTRGSELWLKIRFSGDLVGPKPVERTVKYFLNLPFATLMDIIKEQLMIEDQPPPKKKGRHDNIQSPTLKFIFDGDVLNPESKATDFDMESDDIIDIQIHCYDPPTKSPSKIK